MTAPAHSELGETEDPARLVPGDPSALYSASDAFRSEATRIGDLRGILAGTRTPTWTGEAAYGWEDAQTAELDKWKAYLKVLETCDTAVRAYAGKLASAQTSAQTAIELWAEGEAKTKTAKATYDAAVDRWADDMLNPPTTGAPAPSPGSFDDPGQALRDEAEETLTKAREELDGAGDDAMVSLGNLEGAKKTGDVDLLHAGGSASGPKISWGNWSDTFGKDPRKGAGGKYDSGQEESPFKISLGSAKGDASLLHVEGTWEDRYGDVKVNADGAVTVAGVEGEASAAIDKNGAHVKAGVSLIGVKAEGSVGAEYGVAEVGATSEAVVLASAEGDASLGLNGAHAQGEVFAGAKAGGTVSGDVAGIGGEGTAEAWAGIGAAGHVDFGFDDGKFTIGGSGALAFGVGGKIGGNVTIDVEQVADVAGDVASATADFADGVADTVGDLVPDIDVTPW